jgi:hypothetical protein
LFRCARNDEIEACCRPAATLRGGAADETVQQLTGRGQGSLFEYRSQPNWPTYAGLLAFAETLQPTSPTCARAT